MKMKMNEQDRLELIRQNINMSVTKHPKRVLMCSSNLKERTFDSCGSSAEWRCRTHEVVTVCFTLLSTLTKRFLFLVFSVLSSPDWKVSHGTCALLTLVSRSSGGPVEMKDRRRRENIRLYQICMYHSFTEDWPTEECTGVGGGWGRRKFWRN